MKDADTVWRAPAERQHATIATRQLRDSGLSRRQVELRVQTGQLLTVFRGVFRLAGSPVTFEQGVMAATVATGGVASHRSASRLWGLRGCESDAVEVLVGSRRRSELRGVVSHTTGMLDPVDVTERRGIPVTTPARTLLDLGAVVPDHVVEAALEDALHRDMVSLPALPSAAATCRRVRARRHGGPPPAPERA